MRSATAILTVKLLGDNQTSKAFRDAQAKVEQFEAGMDRASVAATAGLAAIGAGAWKAVDAASNLQQSAGAVESVFGGAALPLG